jgi:hypothetical protein
MMRLIGASLVDARPTQNRSGPIALSSGCLLHKLLMLDRLAAQPAAAMVAIGRYPRGTTDASPGQAHPRGVLFK